MSSIGRMLKKIFELKESIKMLDANVKTRVDEAKSLIVSADNQDEKGNCFLEEDGYKGLVVKNIELDQEAAIDYIKRHYPDRDDLIKVVEKTSVELLSKVMGKEEIMRLGFGSEVLSLRVTKVN